MCIQYLAKNVFYHELLEVDESIIVRVVYPKTKKLIDCSLISEGSFRMKLCITWKRVSPFYSHLFWEVPIEKKEIITKFDSQWVLSLLFFLLTHFRRPRSSFSFLTCWMVYEKEQSIACLIKGISYQNLPNKISGYLIYGTTDFWPQYWLRKWRERA